MNIIQKIKNRKLSFGLLLLILAWLVLPTGDPSDILITLPLIGVLGLDVYLVIAAIILALNVYFNGSLIKRILR